jgi:hypothetical protein
MRVGFETTARRVAPRPRDRRSGGRKVAGLLLALATGMILLLIGARAAADEPKNLLAGLAPSRAEGVRRAHVLTDGVQAASGAGWNTTLSAVLVGRRSFVEYDLGRIQRIDAVYLQADNDDFYVLSASSDGTAFHELWVAAPADRSGMRARSVSALGAVARYVRLSARAGDGSYGVSELQLYPSVPQVFPPRVETRTAAPPAIAVRNSLLTFGLALAVFALFALADLPWHGLLVVALVPASAAVSLASALGGAWPLESRELSCLRAVMAAVALFVLVRERLGRRYPASATALNATLAVAALFSAASFYDLGRPQFWNAKEARPEFVHQADMRIYQPFTKFFDELGYDGVYQASIAAYVEDVPGASFESLEDVEIRDLRTHRVERVAAMAPEISRISSRFTPERWAEFKRDMRYFRETMGNQSYLATHVDHGANATPVWVALAQPWLAFAPASERALVLGGLLDPLLLGAMFVVVGFTFGLRSMLLSIIVFGATDLYMFGTNWGGATLRHDWIAYLGLGVCALRRERWLTAGLLFGLSLMIRAFPATALIGVGSACGMGVLESLLRERRLPNFRGHFAAHAPALRVLAGAAACVVLSVAITSAMFGFERWIEWWRKVALLDSDICTNDVSLRAFVAFGTDQAPNALLRARLPLFFALFALSSALILAVTKRVRLHQAALLALPLIVVVFNPANYYVHFIALLPILGQASGAAGAAPNAESSERAPLARFTHLAVSGPLLALCVAEYWAVLEPDLARHFQYETLFTFVALGWLYANVARTLWPDLTEAPASAPLAGAPPRVTGA